MRRGPLPLAIAELIRQTMSRTATPPDRDGREGAPETDGAGKRRAGPLGEVLMLPPAAAAVAVMALLAFGVVVGSAVSPVGQSGALAPIVVAMSPAKGTSSQPPPTPAATATPPPETAAGAPAEPTAAASAPQTTIMVRAPAAGNGEQPAPASSEPTTPTLPAITHVFLIVLSDQGFNAAFGAGSQAPYLASTLTRQGELLDNYYGVSEGELANGVGLISGQGPTVQTAANCPLYADIAPGSIGAQGQVLGSGCVYPRQALTVGDQLTSDGKAWAAYVEGAPGTGQARAASCSHPALGGADPKPAPTAADPSVTWRDPFLYFHSIIDNPTCSSSLVGLEQLTGDLANASKTPSLAYIVPDRCHDGSEQACAPGSPSGLAAADAFLRTVVPEIESSPAYQQGGLIAITFDQAPQSGPSADASGCCLTSAYPNVPSGAGGAAGASGSPGASGTGGPAVSLGATGASGATGVSGAGGANGVPGATGSTGASALTPAGGGRVGLLLISKYVKPGSVNVIGDYNHFSLLASIEDLFSLSRLGYAGSPGVLAFDASVYNAK
jgi:phosphatidylinositol-3-phosphatase